MCEPYDYYQDNALQRSIELNRRCLWCGDLVIPKLSDGIVPDFCAACLTKIDAPLPLTFDGLLRALARSLRRQLEQPDKELKRLGGEHD